jgi:hypothetical protein
LTKTKSSRHNNNPLADDVNNNADSYSSSSYDKWLKSFYGDMGWKPLFYNWDKPTTNTTTTSSFYNSLKQCTKAVDKAEKLLNKINSSQTLVTSRLKSIPQNATIMSEYIKCGKDAYMRYMDHTTMHIGKMQKPRS